MKRSWMFWGLAVAAGIFFVSTAFRTAQPAPQFTVESKVSDLLFALGDPKPDWYPSDLSEENIRRGKELIFNGRTDDPKGGTSKYISVYYMCTNCHNTVIEDPDLAVADPVARLNYAKEKQIPFLQGTTFYGITNRESWYNDDYYKKYGDLVKPAATDLGEAVQLCGRECSQGRPLEEWEEQAILAYYTTIGYTLADLGYSESEAQAFNAQITDKSDKSALIASIKSRYMHKSPATFIEPPYSNYWEGLRGSGNAENGQLIYELSCQACHKSYGVSDVVFGDSRQDFRQLSRWFDKNDWWLFQVVRHGTHPAPGHRPYMPHYTAERMTDQQVEDLRAFILLRAGKGS